MRRPGLARRLPWPLPAPGVMRVVAAYYENLAGRLYGLLIGLDDRIGREQAQWLHHVIEVGEYGLALEDIAGTLAQDAIAITGQGRGDMLALASQMKLEADLVPRALAACPETGG